MATRAHRVPERTFIKESLGEYGSGWEWDNNTYAHVFDQETSEGIPYRLSNNGTSFDILKDFCKDELEITQGQILHSGHVYTYQTSCKANTGNAGNWYSWATATAGGDKLNSTCPKGWQTPSTNSSANESFYRLIKVHYTINSNSDSNIRLLPFSFIRPGRYRENFVSRGEYGHYLSSVKNSNLSAYILMLYGSYDVNYSWEIRLTDGFSLRCVAAGFVGGIVGMNET